MTKQNQIKVFKANDKRCDFTIRSVTTDAGVRAAEREIAGLGGVVAQGFKALQDIKADSLTLRHMGRRIKVELAA